ncbi:unnamed protein product [Cyclocybe aegerita]|uniref:Cytochrome P450 n=1 Tax=Cyclocybe aegerita TaxID=1973307 RepID=A0A8S0X1V3_CYCAE|nr:unnamed protein product [Cyclocybe aegerita]
MLSTFLLLSSLCLLIIWRFRKIRRFPSPPGPKGWPLIGNAFDFPTSNPWEVYCSWAKQYNSDILYGSALGTHILVLNNRSDAEELLERRSHNYSGRPSIPMVHLMGWDYNIGLMDYGPQWRFHRKICQQTFRQEAAVCYYPTQARKVHEILGNLLLAPEKLRLTARCTFRLSVAIPMATMYGYDVKSFEDEFIDVAEKGQHLGNRLLVPGATLLNIIPILCRLPPIAGAARLAAYVRQLTEDMQRLPMEFAKNAMAAGDAKPSLVTSFLEKKAAGPTRELEEEEQAISKIAATVYSAAADTVGPSELWRIRIQSIDEQFAS